MSERNWLKALFLLPLVGMLLAMTGLSATAAPPVKGSPETTIISVTDLTPPVFVDDDGNGVEGVSISYTIQNATKAQYQIDTGSWLALAASPAAVDIPVGDHVLRVRAVAKDGTVDATPASANLTICPAAGCATATPTPTETTTPTPTPTPTETSTTGVTPAKSTKDFTGGVCVNAHWYFGSTPYTTNYAALKTALQDLNITCVRDQWNPASTTQKNRFIDLAAAGIKHDVIIDSRRFNDEAADRTAADTNSNGAVSVAEAIDHLLDNAPGSVLSIEGMNENLSTTTGCNQTISEAQQIWATKQADSRLADIPVLSPAAAHPTQNACLGDLSAYTDEGNIHSYPGGYTPDASERGSPWSLAGWKSNVAPVVGDVPIQATETFYNTAVNTTSGHFPVSEAVDGKYSAQLPFAYQLNGVHRAYKYELVNQQNNTALDNIEANFGLLRNDLSEKPSYKSLNNTMDLLNDSNQATLSKLDYTISADAPSTVRQYLLQKSDGSHWLAVWNDVSAWNTSTKTETPVADVNVSITVPDSKNVTVYRPYSGVDPVSTSPGGALSVPVNVHPTLVKVS
jgi:hypothetical protein